MYIPYPEWEDYEKMWRKIHASKFQESLNMAIKFTGDHVKYGEAMIRVIREWPKLCIHNLTDLSLNRKAWIGHAACALELGIPEYIIRQAWGQLTDNQRNLANQAAERAIMIWELENLQNDPQQLSLFSEKN